MRWLLLPIAAVTVASAQLCFAGESQHPEPMNVQESAAGTAYLAEIELHTTAELHSVLKRADKLFSEGGFAAGNGPPVTFILHGAEAKALQQSKYQQNKALVDLAARLSAFQVVDIKVCETWMNGEKIDAKTLPPFIGTVANGPAEKKRLMQKQGYVYF